MRSNNIKKTMIQYRDRLRKKAFIGAVIGAAASIAGGIIKGAKQKKAQERQQAEAQAAQDHKDALQNARALTSSYANQDYVDQYNDKLTLKCGGRVRTKANFGAEFAEALPGLGNLFGAVTGVEGMGNLGATIGSNIATNQQTNDNIRIAQEAERNKQIRQLNKTSNNITIPMTQNARNRFIEKYACGGRKKAWIGAAIGAAGSLIGGALGDKGNKQVQVKQDDQAAYSAPKIGIERPEWINNDGSVINQSPQPVYQDRLRTFRYGGRRR